jgi:hypothetical protein
VGSISPLSLRWLIPNVAKARCPQGVLHQRRRAPQDFVTHCMAVLIIDAFKK